MKRMIMIVLGVLMASAAYASDWTGNVNFFLGGKTLEKNDWKPLEEQGEFGILIDFGKKDWGVNIAIDLLGSRDTKNILGVDVDARTSEFDVGVRKVFEVEGTSMRPFIGGGLAFIRGEIEGCLAGFCASDSGRGTGLWLDGGIFWTLGEGFNIGFELRHSQAKATIAGYEGEVGGSHGGLLLGYHW